MKSCLLHSVLLLAGLTFGSPRAQTNSYANPLIGSGGSGFGSGGQNPGAQFPFGALRLGPDTTAKIFGKDAVFSFDHFGGYNFEDRYIRAFSHTHMVGAGVGDFGNFGALPLILSSKISDSQLEQVLTRASGHSAKFSHDTEHAEPGYYRVELGSPASAKAELVATSTHTGSHKYTWMQTLNESTCGVLLDVCHTAMNDGDKSCKTATVAVSQLGETSLRVNASMVMAGSLTKRADSGGVAMFLSADLHFPGGAQARLWQNGKLLGKASTRAQSKTGSLGTFLFTKCPSRGGGKDFVTVNVALSFVSQDQALVNLLNMGKNGTPKHAVPFDALVESTRKVWNDCLGSVLIENENGGSASDESMTKFYSSLYNSYKAPTTFSEYGGVYRGMDDHVRRVGDVSGDKRKFAYTDMSLWDVHRTQFPWLSLTKPEVYEDVVASIQEMARAGGDLPRWPLANVYTGCMIGNHGMVSLVEAVVKGQAGKLNKTFVYEKMKLAATTPRPHGGRSSVKDYLTFGYVPSEDDSHSVSLTLAYAFDDSVISTLAGSLGLELDASEFYNRSRNAFRKLWSSDAKLMCPRSKNGTVKCPSAREARTPYPFEHDYTEGDALQWLWFVPHDPRGLVQLFNNNASFVGTLDDFIGNSRSPKQGGKWVFGTFLANSYYWAGNEPDLLAPWLFPFAGRQSKTAFWTRWLGKNVYGSSGKDGLPGNDDYGTMSAWYLWASLGFYPLAGTDQFVIGSPSFSNATVVRPWASNINIVAHGATDESNVYIQHGTLNGRNISGPILHWGELNVPGGVVRLEFWLGPNPVLDKRSPWV